MVVFSAPVKRPGSNRTEINASLNGKPLGQLWTFTIKGETHGWHAKTLGGAYKLFENKNKKIAGFNALAWMNQQAA